MNDPKHEIRQRLSIQEGEPTNWFEPLYAGSGSNGEGVPWANMETHPSFARWLERNPLDGEGKTALVVGCGMGDDAIELENRGFRVTAFDVSRSAITYCRERFPDSAATFEQADLLEEQPHWAGKFDFVLEIYTVQALPPAYESRLIENISRFVAPTGLLLVVAEVAQGQRSYENGPPWLLTPGHVDAFAAQGLNLRETHTEASDMDGAETYVSSFGGPAFRAP